MSQLKYRGWSLRRAAPNAPKLYWVKSRSRRSHSAGGANNKDGADDSDASDNNKDGVDEPGDASADNNKDGADESGDASERQKPNQPRQTPSSLLPRPLFAICIASLIGLAALLLNHALRPTTLTPRPPAMSPPRAAPGLAPPSHYTFTPLPIVSDLVAISLAIRQTGTKLCSSPALQRDMYTRAEQALAGMGDPLAVLAIVLARHDSTSTTYIPDVGRFREAVLGARDRCRAAEAVLGASYILTFDSSCKLWPHSTRGVLSQVRQEIVKREEEERWVFHPDEEDRGEYDELTQVGDVNFQEAATLNRSATGFLAELDSDYLPKLLELGRWNRPEKGPRRFMEKLGASLDQVINDVQELSRVDWVAEAGLSLPEEAFLSLGRPGWLRRTFLWTTRRDWQSPCSFTDYPDDWMYSDDYYHATRLRCVVVARRAVEADLLPLLRRARRDLAEALALYDTGVVAAAEDLRGRVRELLAGRGWELAEPVQVGMTADEHWAEVRGQQSEERRGGSRKAVVRPPGLQNVTIWRRMVLGLGQGSVDLLTGTLDELARDS